MGYKIFEGNKVLKSCRSMNFDVDCHLNKVRNFDFNDFDCWAVDSEEWGYIELPGRINSTLAFIGQRECLHGMFIKILQSLRFPCLQRRALLFIPEGSMVHFVRKCLEAGTDNSIIWSALTMWFFHLNNEGTHAHDKEEWLKECAINNINELGEMIMRKGKVIELMKWLFSHKHHEWAFSSDAINIKRNILLLMEAYIISRWDDTFYDPDNTDIDYLTFVSLDVADVKDIHQSVFSHILTGYHMCVNDKHTRLKAEFKENDIRRMHGYGVSFFMCNKENLLDAVRIELADYRCYFEGWKNNINKPDYINVTRNSFIIGGLLTMVKDDKLSLTTKSVIINLLAEELFKLCHFCPIVYMDCLSVSMFMLRICASNLDKEILNDIDARLIEEISEMKFILDVFNYSIKSCPLSERNKEKFKKRWGYEYSAIEAIEMSTKSSDCFKSYVKIADMLIR